MAIYRRIMRLVTRIVDNAYAFSVTTKMLGVVIAVIYSAIYNRYLGAELKGEAAIIGNYASLFSSILCLGMYQAYPFYRKKGEDIFYPFINTVASLYSVILVALILLVLFVKGISLNLRIAILMIAIQAYIRHINYVVTIERPKERNIAALKIHAVDILIICIFAIWTDATYRHMVLILMLQLLANLIISFRNLHVAMNQLHFTLSRVPEFAKFGFMPMITLLLMTINYRIDILMLENTNAVSIAEIGIYSVGVSLAEKVWLIPDAIKDILLSRLCKGHKADEVAKVIRINLLIAILLLLGVVICSDSFVFWVYGEAFTGAGDITKIILIGIVGMIFYKMVYVYNISEGNRAVSLGFLAIAAFANVLGNIVFIPSLGVKGAAITSVLSYTLCGFCFLIYYQRKTQIPFRKILLVQPEDYMLVRKYMFSSKKKDV